MIHLLTIALLQALPVAIPIPSPPPPTPSATPTPRATPSRGPLGTPRQFSRPLVHPISPQRVDIVISGPPRDPLPSPATLPYPRLWPVGLPSLRRADGTSEIEVFVTDHAGAVVARGIPQQIPDGGYEWVEDEAFDLDHVLEPSADAYTITARYRDEPPYAGTSPYIISDVPLVEPHVGEPYILVYSYGAPISTIFYVRSIAKDDAQTFLTLRTRGGHRIEETIVLPRDRWMIGPMVVSPDLADVRRHYLDADATFHDVNVTCYNESGAAGRVALLPGKHVHIDLIVRASHTTTWIPNDPETPIYCFGACDGTIGTFVDSPLIVGFRLDPSDIRFIPPRMGGGPSSFRSVYKGKCDRGYVVLRDPDQMRDIFTVSP